MTEARVIDWNEVLTEQLTYHWQHQLRPRLEGLTDAEYRWEPVPGSWNVRPREHAGQPGSGPFTIDWEFPEPSPARSPRSHGGSRTSWSACSGCASRRFSAARRQATTVGLTRAPRPRRSTSSIRPTPPGWPGCRGLGEAGLSRLCGPAEGPFAERPLADLVTHIHREVIHHGAELGLLRDLYAHRFAGDEA